MLSPNMATGNDLPLCPTTQATEPTEAGHGSLSDSGNLSCPRLHVNTVWLCTGLHILALSSNPQPGPQLALPSELRNHLHTRKPASAGLPCPRWIAGLGSGVLQPNATCPITSRNTNVLFENGLPSPVPLPYNF